MQLFAHLPDAPAYSTWLPARSDLGLTDGGVLTFCAYLVGTRIRRNVLTDASS